MDDLQRRGRGKGNREDWGTPIPDLLVRRGKRKKKRRSGSKKGVFLGEGAPGQVRIVLGTLAGEEKRNSPGPKIPTRKASLEVKKKKGKGQTCRRLLHGEKKGRKSREKD